MTDTRKVQLAAEMDSTGVRKGTGEVKDAVRDMAQQVAQESGKAAKAVDGIGAGGSASAEKLDRATRSIIGSVERATAAMKVGERGSAAYFETLAQQRGANADALKPYLEQLRLAEAGQARARTSLDGMGMSARATAAAMRGVPAQLTDIIASLQGGQKPLTVLLQQGGQLKDMFGGVGAAARAMGTYVLGLVNPFTVVAAAAGVLAYAYNKGANESQAFQRTTILSGQVAGVAAGQFNDMAAAINAMGAGTRGRAAELLNSIAGSADIGAANMQRFVAAAMGLEKVGGPAAEETAKAFASLAKDPLAAALKLNETTGFLTRSLYEQIKALTDQGRTTEAARVAQEALAASIEQRTPQMASSVGTLEAAWNRVWSAIKGAGDLMLSIGRDDGPAARIAALMDERARLRPGSYSAEVRGREIDAELAYERQALRMSAQQASAAGARAASVKAAAEWDKEAAQYVGKREQMQREIAKSEALGAAAGKSRVEIERQIAAIREKYSDKAPKASANPFDTESLKAYASGMDGLAKVALAATAGAEGLSKTQAKLREIQADPAWGQYSRQQREQILYAASLAQREEDRAAAVEAGRKAVKDAAAEHARWMAELAKGGDAALRQAQDLRDEADAAEIAASGQYSLKQATELVVIARLKERQVMMMGNPEAVAAVQREIDARTELVGLIGSHEARAASTEAAKEAEREWKRASQHISDSITDSLMRGFESGKSFAANLRDTVAAMFKTLVLRPIVSAVVNPIAGAITGALGFSGAANAAGAAGSNTLANAGGLASLAGTLGTAGSFFGSGLGMALSGNAGLAFQASGAMLSGGSTMAGLATGIGAAAPYLAAAAIVYQALTADKNAKLGYGSTTGQRLFEFGRGTEVGSQDSLVTIAQAVKSGIESTATGLGGRAGAGLAIQAATDIDRKGKGAGIIAIIQAGAKVDGVQTGGSNSLIAGATKLGNAADLGAWFASSTSAAIIAGLKHADLPAKFQEYFAQIDAFSLTTEQADAVLATAAAAQKLGTAFEGLGGAFARLDELSVSASESLLSLFGGIDAFTTATNTYLQNYYSEAERTVISRKSVSDTLAQYGLAMPGSRAEFRALVDAQDLTTDSGRKAYAALISVSSAFADLTKTADATATAVSAVQGEIARLRGTSASTDRATLMTQFAISTAAARGGDAAALAKLPAISQALEQAAKATASSALDVARMRAWLARSLGDTLSTVPGFATGGSFGGGLALVGEQGPELVSMGPARIYSATDTAGMLSGNTDALEARLADVSAQLSDLVEIARATALHGAATAKALRRVMPDGDALAVRTAPAV